MRDRKKSQRGFTLIIVVLVVAVMAMMGVSLLQLIRLDLNLVGQSRINALADDTAEGALMEVINNTATPDKLPLFDTDKLTASVNSKIDHPDSSQFSGASTGGRQSYTADIHLLRMAPVSESSHTWSRALVYEIATVGNYDNGRATQEVRSEVYKVFSFEPGVVLPNSHYR